MLYIYIYIYIYITYYIHIQKSETINDKLTFWGYCIRTKLNATIVLFKLLHVSV